MIKFAAALLLSAMPALAQQVAIDADDIGGVVTGPKGPEAGVWVIAETKDLPTRFARMVVTDDQGRYVVPDLPKATYTVWARGYGLVDSAKAKVEPGKQHNITAVPAKTAVEAAHYYPAISWFSMLEIPKRDQFGGHTDIPENITQEEWLNTIKTNGCITCHQIGQQATRTIHPAHGTFESSMEAWVMRVQSGLSGEAMVNTLAGKLGGAPFKYFAEWTDRIAAGEVPKQQPKRPEGVERNLVVTTWDWMDEKHYLHDLISSDRRDPTVNAYGLLVGSAEHSSSLIPLLDPVKHVAKTFDPPMRDPDVTEALGQGFAASDRVLHPSAYWGEEKIWDSKANNHNAMFDRKGRVWLTARFRNADNPAFCKAGSDHPSAKLAPLDRNNRQITILDTKSLEYTFVDICFSTHHLQFGYDKDDTLWTSGGGPVVGWVNMRVWDETGDAAKAQGWTQLILDTNGNGKRDAHVEPDQPLDATKDKRIQAGFYAVMPNPVDGSIWGSFLGNPGAVIRLVPGANPPATALAEIFYVPKPGFGVRGADIDSKGVLWVSLASGHLGRFDRNLCKGPLNGPDATGNHCPEGWSFFQYPGPGFEGLGENSAESSYYTWVDQHDTLGLGKDVPVSTGNLNDGLIAYHRGKMVTMRVPYPMGFFAKGMDGRIDDPKIGWKGRGIWASSGDRAPWQYETGKGTTPMAVHFQMRPDPLAK